MTKHPDGCMIQHNMKAKPKVVRRYHYQGREIQATIQAPNLKALNAMISGMRAYARQHNLGTIKVLSRGRDPDGGYEAVISAHNANPFRWVAKKWEGRGGGWGSRTARAALREQQRFRESKLKETKLARKESLLRAKTKLDLAKAERIRAKAKVQLAKAERETAVARKRKAYMTRPKGYKIRKITSLGW